MSDVKTIGIGIVEHEGHVLVGYRQKGQELAGLAEFPGGKCEQGERPDKCVVRECLEETGLDVKPLRLLARKSFEYPHATVDLHFWLCGLAAGITEEGEELSRTAKGFRWVPVDSLGEFSFPEANGEIVEHLISGGYRGDASPDVVN